MAEQIIFTVRVYGAAHESRSAELAHVDRVCASAARAARAAGGGQLNGVVLADGGAEQIGDWQFLPLAVA